MARIHGPRHACGSLLIQQGVRPNDVQMILRHSNGPDAIAPKNFRMTSPPLIAIEPPGARVEA